MDCSLVSKYTIYIIFLYEITSTTLSLSYRTKLLKTLQELRKNKNAQTARKFVLVKSFNKNVAKFRNSTEYLGTFNTLHTGLLTFSHRYTISRLSNVL